jgi:1,4-dihydroxy-6-naphthoate synthase
MSTSILKLGHSPDSDDAFMFYALAKGLIDTEGLSFEHILRDIQTLNEWSLSVKLDITAISFYAYTRIFENYAIISSGSSVGFNYGPMIVSTQPLSVEQLRKTTIAVPGEMTTAFLVANLALGKFSYAVMPFNQIMQSVASGQVQAGLIIHEGQLTFADQNLCCSLDLGEWWLKETSLPLPLGCNVIRRDLGPDMMQKISRVLRRSIDFALANRRDALKYALEFAPHLDSKLGDKFVSMYVNDFTLDLGENGKRGVNELLKRSAQARLSDWPLDKKADFV